MDEAPLDRNQLLQHLVQLSLDPFTAHRELQLSDRNRRASRTGRVQDYPDHPDRFDCWVQVLAREALTGRRYWELDWTGSQVAVGVAYESIGRKGSSDSCRLGQNRSSWSLELGPAGLVLAHGGQEERVVLPPGPGTPPRRVGVLLDQDRGRLWFYAVDRTVDPTRVRLLVQVQTRFQQPLVPGVWLGDAASVWFWTPN